MDLLCSIIYLIQQGFMSEQAVKSLECLLLPWLLKLYDVVQDLAVFLVHRSRPNSTCREWTQPHAPFQILPSKLLSKQRNLQLNRFWWKRGEDEKQIVSKELVLLGSKLYREARDKTIFSFVFISHWVPAPQDLLVFRCNCSRSSFNYNRRQGSFTYS